MAKAGSRKFTLGNNCTSLRTKSCTTVERPARSQLHALAAKNLHCSTLPCLLATLKHSFDIPSRFGNARIESSERRYFWVERKSMQYPQNQECRVTRKPQSTIQRFGEFATERFDSSIIVCYRQNHPTITVFINLVKPVNGSLRA
jgi:hypothetical protein